jgi:hypothetical protein
MPSAGFELVIPAIKQLQSLRLKPLGHRERPRHGLPTRSGETTLVLHNVHPPHDDPSYASNRCACAWLMTSCY